MGRRARVTEIECLVPDLAGVARGKIMPAAKFFDDTGMALPSSIFMQTISGEYPEEDGDSAMTHPTATSNCGRTFPRCAWSPGPAIRPPR